MFALFVGVFFLRFVFCFPRCVYVCLRLRVFGFPCCVCVFLARFLVFVFVFCVSALFPRVGFVCSFVFAFACFVFPCRVLCLCFGVGFCVFAFLRVIVVLLRSCVFFAYSGFAFPCGYYAFRLCVFCVCVFGVSVLRFVRAFCVFALYFACDFVVLRRFLF